MRKIKTNDGSESFFNDEINESYHSLSGAVEESIEKFARPAKTIEKAMHGRIAILDICFGLGYNSAAAIELALGANKDAAIEILGIELDRKIIRKALSVKNSFRHYGIIRKLAESINDKETEFSIKKGNISIKLVIGDAVNKLKGLKCCFDIVFLDAFSPKKQPELWQLGFIRDISRVMKKSAVLTTYSCAKPVRERLRKAGFEVMDGPRIGRRSPSTIAVRK